MGNKYDLINLFLETYNYNDWFQNKESTDTTEKSDKKESAHTTRKIDKEGSVDLSDMSSLVSDEEEGKGLKILTPNKLSTRLPILLAKIKAGNNSCKLKNDIRQILYLLYQHNKITKNVYNSLIKPL